MKKLQCVLVIAVALVGGFQLLNNSLFAEGPQCGGILGYQCGQPGDIGAPCGVTTELCECKFHIFIGTVCELK